MFSEAAYSAADVLEDHIGLWEWRRRIAELYAEIRALDDPEFAWRLWRDTRDELFRTHRSRRSTPPGGVLSAAYRCSITIRPSVASWTWRQRPRPRRTICPVAVTGTSS